MTWVVIWEMPYSDPICKLYDDAGQARARYDELARTRNVLRVQLGEVAVTAEINRKTIHPPVIFEDWEKSSDPCAACEIYMRQLCGGDPTTCGRGKQ